MDADAPNSQACSIDDCESPKFARGWCSKHYSRWQRHGDPLASKRSPAHKPGDTEKWCPRCEKVQPVDAFRKRGNGRLKGWCSPCEATYQAEHAGSAEGREQRRRARAGWNTRSHGYFLKYRYGITLADYEALLVVQGGRCAICATDKPGGNLTKWSVDHCHDSAKVRGLLCAACNMGIGQLGDDPGRMRAAADYIDRHR